MEKVNEKKNYQEKIYHHNFTDFNKDNEQVVRHLTVKEQDSVEKNK